MYTAHSHLHLLLPTILSFHTKALNLFYSFHLSFSLFFGLRLTLSTRTSLVLVFVLFYNAESNLECWASVLTLS